MSSFALKILALITMTIDHIGFAILPQVSILRMIGRLSFPIFAFQISVGYKNTQSKEKYIFRMLLFTLVSQIPYQLIIQSVFPRMPSFDKYRCNLNLWITRII